jgi:hypothetical protein
MTTTKADMIKPSNGLVISYNYLWAREHDDREVSGRKARPACVQIIIQDDKRGTVVALFPITSQPPHATRTALEIPEMDARRIGLKSPSWIMVDEWNLDDFATSPHIADSRPIGSLSAAFMKRVRTAAADRIRARRYRSIPRR